MTAKEKAADRRLHRTYGITLEEYERVLNYQNRQCAICDRPAASLRTRLAVDHCHVTGLLRGLLCWGCNRAIAVFREDTDRLLAAVAYLREPPVTQVFTQARYTAPGRVGSRKRAKLLRALKEAA